MANNTAIASGNWETGANWSTGVAPVLADNVVIPAGFTITITAVGDVCGTLTINATGTLTMNANESLSIAGSFANAGTFTAKAGSTLTFNGAANSTITGGGTYSITGTVVMNMGAPAITLDVQDANFISGINTGAKYYFTFTQGTWRMDNAGTLNNAYNSGSATALTIPFGVTIESDAGIMTLGGKATSGNMLLSGKLFLNGGTVLVQTGQTANSGQDFRYKVNGGTPQLYISSGTLYTGAGFNANSGTDYIDFHMTGGTMIVAEDGYSFSMTFQLQDVLGGKTFMTGGLIILQDACNAAIADLDMGGANVAATQYSVTGGTVQIGYAATQGGATFFAINAEPATNYPNIDFQSGTPKTVSAWVGGTINMLSLYVNSNMTFDATGFPLVNIMSNNGTIAFDDEGGFISGNNTVEFSGAVPQVITSSTLANEPFYNLQVSNTSGNVILSVNTTVANQLKFTSGLLDASKKTLTLSNGSVAVTGQSATSYVIVGNGFNSFGTMTIDNLPASTNTAFPIGTATYYLPAGINPGAITGSNFTTYVFTPAKTNAAANGPAFSAALQSNMLSSVWNIAQSGTAGPAALTLNWQPSYVALEGAIFQTAGTGIGIIQYLGAASGWSVPTGGGSVPGGTANSNFTTFTQFAVVDNLFVLPITITDFNAVLKSNRTVSLSWNASEGMGITLFDVQRSTDGTNFTTLGTVDAADNETDYSFIDPNPSSGANEYRLLIHTETGAVSYSGIRTINLASAAGIAVYPVPATTTVNISVANAGAGTAVRLINVTGQVLQSSVTTGNNQIITMDISRYPSGAYFIQVIAENKTLQITPVSKL